MKPKLVILQDTREQRGLGGSQVCLEIDPATGEECGERSRVGSCPKCKTEKPNVKIQAFRVLDPAIKVEPATLGEGDYAAKGFEQYARIERKSGADLWGTVHGDHERFNRELSRLGDIPRVALVIDDALGPDMIAERHGASLMERERLKKIVRSLQWTARIPVVWAGNRDAAARYVVDVLASAVEDYSMIPRCEEIARSAGPYTTPAELRKAALASLFGLCVVCARRPGTRPKPQGEGVCKCGRKALAA